MENKACIIKLISTSTVKPTSHQESIHSKRIELTPWDLQLLLTNTIQNGLLFLKPTHYPPTQYKEDIENTLIHHLKTSLSRTLDFFSPLAGHLATEKHHDDGTTSYFIVCDNTGAEFTHAVADSITVADVLEPLYVPNIVHSFFPLNGVQNFQGVSKPLLAVQVTELVDGIFIGCTFNHVVGDGTSFCHFFNSWSEISQGNSLKNPPILHRWFLETITPPIRFHLPEDEKLFERDTPSTLLKERVLHFTKEKIAILKAKANAKIGADDNNRISSLQALLSHLWQCVTRCRRLDSDKEMNFWMLIGGRTRISPPLPSHYLGNSIQADFIKMRASELLELGLSHVASKMNEMVGSHTEERARNFLESWVKTPTFLTTTSLLGDHSMALSGSLRFNVYGNDFGWGKPVAVRSGGGNKADGNITIFPGKEEGSVDIETCLLAETWEAMVNDPDFMDALVTV